MCFLIHSTLEICQNPSIFCFKFQVIYIEMKMKIVMIKEFWKPCPGSKKILRSYGRRQMYCTTWRKLLISKYFEDYEVFNKLKTQYVMCKLSYLWHAESPSWRIILDVAKKFGPSSRRLSWGQSLNLQIQKWRLVPNF